MFDGFGAILDRLQGLLGKGYLVTGFFPALLFEIASIPFIFLVAPESPYWLMDFLHVPGLEQTLITFSMLLVTAFAGFFLYLLNSSLRRRFESGILRILGPWLSHWQRDRAQEFKDKVTELRPDLVYYRLHVRNLLWREQLGQARQKGSGASGEGVSHELLEGIEEMERFRARKERIPFDRAESIFVRTINELSTKDAAQVPDLDNAQVRFWDLAVYAHQATEVAFERLHYKLQRYFPRDFNDIGPTALANVNRAHADAIWERYRMNGELFWPVIERVASSDASFVEAMREARLRLDFPISMGGACLGYTTFWLITLYLTRAPRWSFCLLAFLGPAMAILFYWVAFWNAYALNATVRMAIDLYRFKTLTTLHISLPANSRDEAELWSKLTTLEELSEGVVDFQHGDV